MDTILVSMKPELADLVPEYLQNCRQSVITMLDALDRADFETVKFLGHNMRGSGSNYGFRAITDLGAALEQAAMSADTHASRKWVGELSSYLERGKTIVDFPPTVLPILSVPLKVNTGQAAVLTGS